MENLMISANAVLPMCLVMALGYGTRRLGWLHREEISTINKIAFRIFLPCLLYYNIYCSDLSGSFDPLLMAYAVGGVLLTFGLALGYTLLTEKLPERRGVLIQGMFRSNYVIMGIPVATALLGADQLGTVSILIAVIVPLFNMLAVVVLEVFRGQKPKPLHILGQIAKNPLVIGSVLGILTLVAGIRLPHILEQTIQSVSAIASPLQLFLLGAFFQFSGLKTYRRELVTVSIAKLIVSPGLFLGLGALLGFRGVAFVSLIGVFASPTAVNSFTMAQQMGGDAELAGDIVVTTSAASILTMFLWIFLFKSLGMFWAPGASQTGQTGV
ncbi:MAG: AEC family transporter [Oscillospiraceae bacterium]